MKFCLDRTRTCSAGIKTPIANQLQSRGIQIVRPAGFGPATRTLWRRDQDLNLNLKYHIDMMSCLDDLDKVCCSTNWATISFKIIIFSKNNINFFQLTSFIIPRFLQFGKPKSHLTTRNQTSFGGSMLLLESRSDGKSAQLPLAHCLSNDFADFQP